MFSSYTLFYDFAFNAGNDYSITAASTSRYIQKSFISSQKILDTIGRSLAKANDLFINVLLSCGSRSWGIVELGLSKKVGGEAQNLGGDFGGESVLSLGGILGERP